MNETPLVDPAAVGALLFRQMADRIDHNDPASFGGAVVICPPGRDGVPINVLVLDPTQNEAHFWLTLQTKVQAAIAALEEVSRNQNAFVRGR